jgi:hypothetical protein
MNIRYSDVFPILAKSIPGVEADDEDWKEPTPYFFLSDIVRFVCQKANSGSSVEAIEFGVMIERLLLEGDEDIKDLVSDGLECLREQCVRSDAVTCHFGPKTMEQWRTLGAEPKSAFPNAER